MTKQIAKQILGNWEFHFGIYAWKLQLGNFRLGTFAWERSLGNFRLEVSLGHFSLGTFTWELSLGNFRLELSLGAFRLGSEAGGPELLWLGEPVGGTRGNRGDRSSLPGL